MFPGYREKKTKGRQIPAIIRSPFLQAFLVSFSSERQLPKCNIKCTKEGIIYLVLKPKTESTGPVKIFNRLFAHP